MKRILVTGGAGFVGSFLCESLVAQGHEVTCLDNLMTGRLANIAPLMRERGFRFVRADVEQPLPEMGPFQEIYHLACPASPVHYQTDPIRTMRTCVLGAINTLELARACGARILTSSTSEVYGDPVMHPQREEYRGNVNCFGPRACYDEGKRAAETLFHDYHRVHGVDIRVARIFNTYGPRMSPNDGRVVSNFIVQALSEEPLTIYGDGSQTRSFCYVTDLIRGLILLMKSSVTTPVNLGNPGEFTVRELAYRVVALANDRATIEFRDLPKDDPTRRRPDITAAQTQLGWQPEVSLATGLERTVAWFQSELASLRNDKLRLVV